MSVEERFLAAVEEECGDDDDMPNVFRSRRKERERILRKSQATIDKFLDKARRTDAVCILPRYYGPLLTWALRRYLEREGWKVTDTLGYRDPEPLYTNVNTDYDKHENLLMLGHLLVEKDDARFVVTVDLIPGHSGSVQVQGPEAQKDKIEGFANGVIALAKAENFYRGKKIEFAGRICFLNVKDRSWDSIILDPAIKREVKANTVDFLRRRKRWPEFGIPPKRGVLLAGEPGTGKTLVSKALMAQADGITCITTNAYRLSEDEYITDLYELAQDLSPCIVFIEDIDLIGLNREEYHYQHGPALLSLLSVLDGVEERHEIVTVATTNNLETLDRAISQRPSRFDRVIKLSLPSLKERGELVSLLCQKIPLDCQTQDYIAHKAEHCTPAQLQEIVYSLVIEYEDEPAAASPLCMEPSREAIDRAISRINGRSKRRLGFEVENNHDEHESAPVRAMGVG